MAQYKVVLFSDSISQQYMTEQQEAINNALPTLETELANSDDARLALYSTTPTRMPAILILKDNARMQIRHAKLSHTDAINWISARTG
jgi:hypothetical protein